MPFAKPPPPPPPITMLSVCDGLGFSRKSGQREGGRQMNPRLGARTENKRRSPYPSVYHAPRPSLGRRRTQTHRRGPGEEKEPRPTHNIVIGGKGAREASIHTYRRTCIHTYMR